ncbi:EAL domain-containing protein [Roseomonas sp. BN140053]|uniref:bifunctional diguanylate cyclase/phosphodiesterase n=1 Tax=Roseomonas sp. BN140053 TaxID=3391898 RepID=UPI0039E9BB03
MIEILGCLTYEHNLPLLFLAVGVCCMACFVSANVVRRLRLVARGHRVIWAIVAGLVYGCGVWATHFIAMLAFQPGLPISYAPGLTAVSALVAVLGAALAFPLVQASGKPRRGRALAGGTVLGLSVGAMHFMGMSAMRLPGTVEFSPPHAVLSVLAGGGLAALALARRFDRRRGRLAAACLLAVSILCLHFLGMAGTTILPDGNVEVAGGGLDGHLLAITTAAVVAAIATVGLSSVVLEEKLWGERTRDAARLRRLASGTFEGLLIHRGGTILDVNETLARLVGLPAAALVGHDITRILPAGVASRLRADPEAVANGTAALELELVTEGGRSIPVEILSRVIEEVKTGWRRRARLQPACAVAIRDLTERKRAEAQIRYLAHHDGLTGLPNRALLADRAHQVLELAAREGRGAAILCLDLDRFKTVNDVMGHEGGDRLLAQVAERLRASLRASDTVARLGGDEFAIIKADLDTPEAGAALANRVIAALSVPYDLDGQVFEIGTSVGIALFPGDGRTVPRLLHNADTALYRAKRDGRGVYRFFEPAMDQRLLERRAMERDLRVAVERGEMFLVYQPQFDTMTRELVGQEALLRWTHPARGVVPPSDFVPLAEEAGLIIPLGRWVLETACIEAAGWPVPCRVAVNLSPAQFRQPDLVAAISGILERTGLPPQRLKMEVTEGLLIGDTERALTVLRALKAMGIFLSLDDFGTGYSSLGYLRRFPFDELKIDQSFVRGLGRDVESAAIIEAVLALGRSLGLSVVAEGVETEEQLGMLRSRGCPQVQGYLLGRPARSGEFFAAAVTPRLPETLLAASPHMHGSA